MMPDVIRNLEPLNSLPDEMQRQIVNQSQVIPCKSGHIVFQQGDNDDFVFYLLEGVLQLECDGQIMKTVKAGSEEAKYRLAQLRPRQMTAKAITDVTLFRATRSVLEGFLESVRDQQESSFEVCDLAEEDDADWMSKLLSSPLFARISAANIQMVFSRMEPMPVRSGEIIICQGEPGDYYYIIKNGRCRVSRRSPVGMKDIVLAELEAGDSFGEEALISNGIRSASVTMDTDGELMRLNREQFYELLMKPTLKGLSQSVAVSRITKGAVWLDVRSTQAHTTQAPENSLNLPLPLVRAQHKRLDQNLTYIACCDDGSLSAVAAFILLNLDFEVYFLENGLRSLAEIDEQNKSAVQFEKQEVAQTEPTTILADVRAAALETELSRANVRLQEAARLEMQAEQARSKASKRAEQELRQQQQKLQEQEERANASLTEAQQMKSELEQARAQIEADMEEKLRLERQKIEQQNAHARAMLQEAQRLKDDIEKTKLQAEQESSAAHRKVEDRIQQIESEAQRSIEQERQKLHELADRNAGELEEIKRLKQEAEARLQEERQAMTRTAEENRQQLEEARRMKELLEGAQKAANEEAERLRLESVKKEEALQRKMHADVEAERKRLEQELAANSALIEQAQREKAAAEARLLEEREAMFKTAEESRQQLDEVKRNKEELEASQKAAELQLQEKINADEARQSRMRAEALAERSRLEQELSANSVLVEQARREKEAAEARLHEERQAISRTAEESRLQLDQARRMKEMLQAAQQAAEQQQIERIKQEEERQRALRAEVLAERSRLEQEFSTNSELLAQAQQDKKAAEAARIAARKEAAALIEEYKREHQRTIREQEQGLQKQRMELEIEASRIQQMMLVSRSASRDAGLAVQRAEQDLERLKATSQLLKKQSAGSAVKQQVGKDIAAAESRINKASDQLRSARRIHADAESAQQTNQQKLVRQQAAEESLRKQLEDDLQEWIAEQTMLANNPEQQRLEQSQKEKMQRILSSAEQAHKAARQHDLNLIEELSMNFDIYQDED